MSRKAGQPAANRAVASRPRPARDAAAPRPAVAGRRTDGSTADDRLIGQVQGFAAEWAPTAARVLLGLVLAWFGYHELIAPQLWTGYIPGISTTSGFAIVLVLAHGLVLLILAVAIIAGIAIRLAAATAAVLLLEIVVSLTITGGLTDLTLRDVGVLGLAIGLTGGARQRVRCES